jgi:hypothetical protein
MIKSVNHPWGISDKKRKQLGDTWADIDFVFQNKMSAEVFKEDPMNCTIGHLQIAGLSIKMKYKDLIMYSKSVQEHLNNTYNAGAESTFSIDIKTYSMNLHPHEISKLSETLQDSLTSCMRAYELGLYL